MGEDSPWYHAASCEVTLQPGLVTLRKRKEKRILKSFFALLLCSLLMGFR